MNADPKTKRKILPTPRIAFGKQLDLLRAYAAASGSERRSIGLAEAAPFVGLSKNTISLANPFFTDNGFLERAGNGFLPSPEVVNFAQAYDWDADGASRELAPLMERSWFGEALLPRLGFASLSEKEALRIIDAAAEAGPKYEPQLRVILDYLEAAGLIEREDGKVRSAPRQGRSEPKPSTDEETDDAERQPKAAPAISEGSRSLPLLIQGLLQELPRGSDWEGQAAARWLNLAKMTFELVYGLDDIPFADSSRGGGDPRKLDPLPKNDSS
jgi:hypothetical protein